jgi:sulfur relay (sulfurtransferase) complex TusBCD TusD component (DsrE family)
MEAEMARRKLIFFVAADPAADAGAVSAAYRFAGAAAAVQLDAEVRLAGDAVLVADPAYVATVKGSASLRERIDRAVKSGVQVSVCPASVDARGIRQEQLAALGAQRRDLAEILVEVADGRSVLIRV